MPPLDLVDRLQRLRPLPDAQERLARHLEAHFEQLPFRSANEVARDAGVSKATFVRFVRKLGYATLGDLRHEVRRALYPVADSPAARHISLKSSPDVRRILAEFRRQQELNVRATLANLDPDEVHALCADLIRAETVWVFGQRFSYGVAFNLALLLSQVLPRAIDVAGAGGTLADRAAAMGSKDHLVIVAHRRIGSAKPKLAGYARARGVPYSVFTDATKDVEGLLAGARHVLFSTTDALGVFNSYAPTLSVVEALASVLELLAPTSPARLTEAEIALQTFDAFATEGR